MAEVHVRPAVGTDSLLQVSGLHKRFGGVTALRDVSFNLRAGEVHAIIGENGAGKSTLIKVLTGVHTPDAGTVEIGGQKIERFDPSVARDAGIAVVYQQPALFRELTVAENLALRLERGGPWRILRWGDRRKKARALLDRVGASSVSTETHVGQLGMAEQQLVEIAAAIGADARVMIFDEPTASLGDRETENLFRVIGELKARGVGMIYVSHRLDELPKIADRVSVLRDGSYVGTRPMAEVDRPELIRLMVGRSIESIFPKIDVAIGNEVMRVNGLSNESAGVHDVNFAVRAGEIFGLSGLVGAGRTEIARVLFGLDPADKGEIIINGKSSVIRTPSDAVASGIAYVPEDRRRHGAVLEMTVAENTTLASLSEVSTAGLISAIRERTIAKQFVDRLGTKVASIDVPVGNLSGGNQQKVALARWLATNPKILILDEPTQGVDVGAKAEIHSLICELAGRGLAVVMISSELPEIMGMSDRIAVVRRGTIVGIFDRADATPHRLLELALGHSDKAVA